MAGGGHLELRMFAEQERARTGEGISSLQYCLSAMGWRSPKLVKVAGEETTRDLRGYSSSTKNEHIQDRLLEGKHLARYLGEGELLLNAGDAQRAINLFSNKKLRLLACPVILQT